MWTANCKQDNGEAHSREAGSVWAIIMSTNKWLECSSAPGNKLKILDPQEKRDTEFTDEEEQEASSNNGELGQQRREEKRRRRFHLPEKTSLSPGEHRPRNGRRVTKRPENNSGERRPPRHSSEPQQKGAAEGAPGPWEVLPLAWRSCSSDASWPLCAFPPALSQGVLPGRDYSACTPGAYWAGGTGHGVFRWNHENISSCSIQTQAARGSGSDHEDGAGQARVWRSLTFPFGG